MRKKRVKKPVAAGKVAKVPVVIQLEALECGAACLTMILAYYNKWIPLEKVRIDCGVNRDGSSAINIVKAARYYGLSAAGYKLEPEALKEQGTFPCIIHWNFNHFVVLNGFKGNKVYLNDPAKGNYCVTMEEFDSAFTGICLMFEPTESFVPSGKPKSVWSFVKSRLPGLRVPMAFIVLTTVISAMLGVITPVFNRIFYDRLLTGENPNWVTPFLIALGVLYALQIVINLIETTAKLKINGKINAVGNMSFMWKVLHLPMSFFSQRMNGDILSRQSNNTQIADTLINTFAPLLLNSVMMLFYFVVMIRYSWKLTIIGVVSVLCNMFVSNYISKKRINLSRVQARDKGKLYGTTVSGIQMIETIKSSGAEEGYFAKWSGFFASVNEQEQKFASQNNLLGIIPTVIASIAGSAILCMGVYLTICGQFTLGMITAFQGFFSSFIAPASQLITAGQTIQEMRTQMERVEDVMEYPVDVSCDDNGQADGECLKLSGKIELKNVSFGYAPLSDPLIKNFNLSVNPGESIAIVGASGCGKSTLSKLISGLYMPREGEILFDGKPINKIPHNVFTGSVAVVDQDIVLFEDTIANNIKMWDETIEDFEMILAARDAQIHYDIISRPGGYRHKLIEGGRDFSGGQRQRLEIARVLAQDPTVIILDEATSALDAKTEHDVVKAIKQRGITCIVIAHRLSTVRDCDKILVLDNGCVVEQGTHEQLLKRDGCYKSLVTND